MSTHHRYLSNSSISEIAYLGMVMLGAAGRPPDPGHRRLGLHGLARRFVQPFYLVAHANQKHRLLGILHNVDDPFLLFLEVNRLAVRYQVKVGVRLHNVCQPFAHLALKEPQDPPDFLEGEAFTAEFRDDCNFDYFFRLIDTLVALMLGGDDFSLVPPLQLPQTDLRDARNIAAGECSESIIPFKTDFFFFEHHPLRTFET